MKETLTVFIKTIASCVLVLNFSEGIIKASDSLETYGNFYSGFFVNSYKLRDSLNTERKINNQLLDTLANRDLQLSFNEKRQEVYEEEKERNDRYIIELNKKLNKLNNKIKTLEDSLKINTIKYDSITAITNAIFDPKTSQFFTDIKNNNKGVKLKNKKLGIPYKIDSIKRKIIHLEN